MARKSVNNRNAKRLKIVEKMRAKRDELRDLIKGVEASDDQKWEAMLKLQSMPRDASPSRRRHRCKLCGRPRAYNNKTGLCRLHMRIAVVGGMVPGMHKASW